MMKQLLICSLLTVGTFFSVSVSALSKKDKADKDTREWRYEIEPVNAVARQGAVLVKVWSYSKDAKIATAQAPKNAVHALLFKGCAASDEGRIPMQRPLISNSSVEQEKAAFFEEFFADGGKYQRFVTLVNNGVPAAGDLIKVGKEYKVGLVVSIQKDALRKELEEAGVIKPLGSVF